MKANIDAKGRVIRAALAAVMIAGAATGFSLHWPLRLDIVLLVLGGFTAFESAKGWCALRACGVKTRY